MEMGLVIFNETLHLSTCAIDLVVDKGCLAAFKIGDHKPRVCTLRRNFGLEHNPPGFGPGRSLIQKRPEQPDLLLCGLIQVLRLLQKGMSQLVQLFVASLSQHIIYLMVFAKGVNLWRTKMRICTHKNLHVRPRFANMDHHTLEEGLLPKRGQGDGDDLSARASGPIIRMSTFFQGGILWILCSTVGSMN